MFLNITQLESLVIQTTIFKIKNLTASREILLLGPQATLD